jgi:hypothetical protein
MHETTASPTRARHQEPEEGVVTPGEDGRGGRNVTRESTVKLVLDASVPKRSRARASYHLPLLVLRRLRNGRAPSPAPTLDGGSADNVEPTSHGERAPCVAPGGDGPGLCVARREPAGGPVRRRRGRRDVGHARPQGALGHQGGRRTHLRHLQRRQALDGPDVDQGQAHGPRGVVV